MIIQEMFGMKVEDKKPLPSPSQTVNNPSRNSNNSYQREDRGEIDFKKKYGSELVQLKVNS